MPKWLDDVVICLAVGLGLLIALFLSWQLVVEDADFPPTLISAFLGIAIAALTYRFLGGAADTQFSMGVLKLGGSAALLLGTTWFVGDRLRDEIRLYASMDTYRQQLEEIEADRATRGDEIVALREQLRKAPDARRNYTLNEIKAMQPTDPFVRNLRNLVEGQEGPFRQTLKDEVVRVAVIAAGGDVPRFNICNDVLSKLNEGVDAPNPTVLFTRALEDGNTESIKAARAGRIVEDVCASEEREFDVQVNCPVALALFKDVISSCAAGSIVRGSKVIVGSLAN